MPPSGVDAVLGDLSAGVDELCAEFRKLDHKADFGPLQRRPLLRVDGGHLCLDPAYTLEKAGRAFFWVLRGLYSNTDGAKLLRFWGRVFESYHHWIWEVQYQGRGQFIPGPRWPNGEEIADAIVVEDDSLLLIECKASLVTSNAKHCFQGAALGEELERKFVEDATEGRRKGIGQLARTIANLSGDRRREFPIPLLGINRVYSMLITLDPVVEAPFVREYLNVRFGELRRSVRAKETITPVFVLHIADVEYLLRYTNSYSLTGLLREFTRGQPEAKNLPGPIAGYMEHWWFRPRGIRPGRDVVGDKFREIDAAFRRMFREE